MVKKTLLSLFVIAFAMPGYSQYYGYGLPREDNRDIEKIEKTQRECKYTQYDRGFWFSVEALCGYSANVSSKVDNTPFAEVDAYAGYRFNEYVRVGLGLGGRHYFTPKDCIIRRNDSKWAMPIMLNVRGNFIPQHYRTVVPYYSLDVGGSVSDGFMLRPTIGVRFGERRSAFLLGVSYMLQNLSGWNPDWNLSSPPEVNPKADHVTSFFALRLGYEF